ncbi:MAG: hypothetical protein NXI04_19580 [Planctomycetaceae bacterium]|nr:hypothetical protein [Planctomycetaceae bacterium]
MSSPRDEILIADSAFQVCSRGRIFGPFDYQWSHDLHGIELTYQGVKFGEICSDEELFADLSEFQLPISVCEVAALTAGTIAKGIVAGQCLDLRVATLVRSLEEFGFGRFRIRQCERSELSSTSRPTRSTKQSDSRGNSLADFDVSSGN